jgi:hypothetical protein
MGCARHLNPNSEEHDGDGSNLDIELFKDGAQCLAKVIDLASKLSLPAISEYFSRLMYWLSHLSAKPSAYLHLEQMQQAYADAGDDVGLGLYWLIRGDHNISPPFKCPMLLNFDTVGSTDEFCGDNTMLTASQGYHLDVNESSGNKQPPSTTVPQHNHSSDHTKDDKHLLNNPYLARQCYDKAEKYFLKADAKRGSAVATLRKAYLLIIRDFRPVNFWSRDHNNNEINKLLARAQELCKVSGDIQLGNLAKIHQILRNGEQLKS